MVYEVPASKRSIKQNQFQFKVPGNRKTFSIQKAKYMTVGQIETLSNKGGEVQLTDILDILGQGEAREAVLTLEQEQMMALFEAWQADSGLTMGESSASTETS
jgi:hypothetical protein